MHLTGEIVKNQKGKVIPAFGGLWGYLDVNLFHDSMFTCEGFRTQVLLVIFVRLWFCILTSFSWGVVVQSHNTVRLAFPNVSNVLSNMFLNVPNDSSFIIDSGRLCHYLAILTVKLVFPTICFEWPLPLSSL